MKPLGIRRRLLLLVVAAVTGAIAALVLSFNLILAGTLDRDARDLARTRVAAQLDLLTTENGRLEVRDTSNDSAGDAYIWVFSRSGVVVRPHVGGILDSAAASLAHGDARYLDIPSADVRLFVRPAVIHGRRVGTVVGGVSLAPYEETRRLALIASSAFGAIVLLVVIVAARWLLRSSLRPVRRMTRQAADWSEHDLDHRFAMGEPYDELTELAATLDQLLGRLAASLRREQRFSAELSHELRTPLARVMAESELALRRDRSPDEYRSALELINRNAAQLTRTIDALMAAARHESGAERGTADAYTVAAQAVAGCLDLATQRDLSLTVHSPATPLRVGVDVELGERILQPLIDNACRYGARSIDVSIQRSNGGVLYTIDDDGPGVPAADREPIFEPGRRGAESARNGQGAGLGLPLARRLARSVSGEVAAVDAPRGARFVVTLPRA
jgi:two-component system OmpR family sensor kinase